jgi:hypothetical protein
MGRKFSFCLFSFFSDNFMLTDLHCLSEKGNRKGCAQKHV